jgi:hypothetical protein
VLKTALAIGCAASCFLSSSRARADDVIAACVKAAEDAQSQRSAHQLRAARQQFLACAQESCPLVVRNDCAGWLSEVDKQMPSIVVQARDTRGVEVSDVRVLADGDVLAERLDGLAIAVDPGEHLFQFEGAGVPALQQRILIREGEKNRALPITLAAVPPPPDVRARGQHPSPLFYVFSGLAIGSAAGFTYFGLKGMADADELGRAPCGMHKTCPDSEVAPIRRELLVADVSLGIGLVSLGAAAYLFFSERKAPPSSVRASVLLAPGMGRASLAVPF